MSLAIFPAADSTGTHSLYTTFKDYELMFHVSTLLPYTPNNKQQVRMGSLCVVPLVMYQEMENSFVWVKQLRHMTCVHLSDFIPFHLYFQRNLYFVDK